MQAGGTKTAPCVGEGGMGALLHLQPREDGEQLLLCSVCVETVDKEVDVCRRPAGPSKVLLKRARRLVASSPLALVVEVELTPRGAAVAVEGPQVLVVRRCWEEASEDGTTGQQNILPELCIPVGK